VGKQYDETDDNKGRNGIDRMSYLYEMSTAPCSWKDNGAKTWQVLKLEQLRDGDEYNGFQRYDETTFPVVRCFHHYREGHFIIPDPKDPLSGATEIDPLTLNVAYAGNVFRAPLFWELTGQAKER